MSEYIRVKKDGNGFLVAAMPDGTHIPAQDELTLGNNTDQKGFVHVNFSCKIPIALFKIEEHDS